MKTLSKILLAAGAIVTFLVTATVNGTCGISANPIAFGTYTGTVAAQSSTIQTNCTTGTAFTVSLNNGVNASGVQRRMTNGSGAYIPYQIYTDAAHTTIFNTTNTATGTGAGGTEPAINMYGQTSAVASPASGSYTDTVTATVTY